MTVKNWSTLFVTVALVLLGTQVLAADAQYPVKDSKFPANELATQVFWLDNERILFYGYEPGSYPTPGGDRGFKTGMYVWNIREDRVRHFPNTGGELCYDHGYISYVRLDPNNPGEFLHYSGKIGEEKPARYIRGRGRNDFSCRYYDSYPDSLPADRTTRLLHDAHGYLDLGLPRGQGWSLENAPVTFYRRGSSEGVRLPFGQREIATIRFSVFNSAYLLYGGYIDQAGIDNSWPIGKPQPLWILKPDGNVSQIMMPAGPWNSRGSTMYFLTKKGVFIVSHHFSSVSDAGPGGAYLFDGAKVGNLVTGQVNAANVAPDGCKVAFVFALNTIAAVEGFKAMQTGGAPTQTLRMVDLCAGDGP